MRKKRFLPMLLLLAFSVGHAFAQKPVPERPRILISTDIGGTDPDDNQSMMHYLLYSNEFDCEGLVSSPSFGDGDKSEILRMIDIYEEDLPKLKQHARRYPSPEYLRSITKQGRHGAAPLVGYSTPTEGSEWIVRCARKNTARPLYVLVWGGLDDVAQALHDAPDIARKIRVYWIGGPNKKWGINAYVYIIEHFPDLWMIENNSTYRSFIAKYKQDDRWNGGFYDHYVKGCGFLGEDFFNYLGGKPKLGDTPSLLYMMDGDPSDPCRESWGGSFEKYSYTPRVVFSHQTTARDTAQIYSIIEWHVKGPVRKDIPVGTECITLDIARQKWQGYYMGDGNYMVKYSTYKVGTQPYTITSDIKGFPQQQGFITIENVFPGKHRSTDYRTGAQWYSDKVAPELFYDNNQGAMTVYKWRKDAIEDWGKRCQWLKYTDIKK
ncbi:DUF1593 domain-containing protein [Prevotella sp. PMUR]|uniref:DUF1593 domain-containing protein n=2 Tax=Xylanibacter muris TaxID=2736290 RepID=A0ABX2AKM2_9BACT|nr:nucleoside hydrolase-like domain-containing protein [Xylanibacter muris]NPD91655.1 DUF1593 domain-containing protein [Xylanibacter muris]